MRLADDVPLPGDIDVLRDDNIRPAHFPIYAFANAGSENIEEFTRLSFIFELDPDDVGA